MSTVTEQFFRKHLAGTELSDMSKFLRISGAQGLEVPYLGYIELDLQACGETFPGMGFLVVRDPVGPIAVRKRQVPGVLGCNILQRLQAKLKGKNLPRDGDWGLALTQCEEIRV